MTSKQRRLNTYENFIKRRDLPHLKLTVSQINELEKHLTDGWSITLAFKKARLEYKYYSQYMDHNVYLRRVILNYFEHHKYKCRSNFDKFKEKYSY